MRRWTLLTTVLLVAITGIALYTSATIRANVPQVRTNELTEAAQALYHSAAQGNRQLVYQQVQQLRHKSARPELRASGQAEGWGEIDQMLGELTSGLQGASSAHEVRVASARLSLAFDALQSGPNAAWRSYYPLLREDISRLNKAWHRQTDDHASAALAAARGMREHYRMIEAAALLQQQPALVQTLDISIHYMITQLETAERDGLRHISVSHAIRSLSDDVDRMFQLSADSVPDPVIAIDRGKMPLRFIFMLGLMIVAVLLYAGWQRYKYDRDRYTKA
ncbi:sporulation protein YpjB [Paenibacillus sp. 1P07SE]|uniref:sporulation protein YpjB n=1 Tax=Paenibacillus sp. 1P07SE TaxID=3132209 RepID=UPI0039A4D2B4